jgi:hypothetical protein
VLLRVEHTDAPTVSDRVLSKLIDTARRRKRRLSALIDRRCPNSPTKPDNPDRHPALRLITCAGWFNQRSRNYRDNLIVYARASAVIASSIAP